MPSRHPALREQLAPDLRPPVLLRPVLDALAAAAHLVAGDRGAVLPRLAPRAPAPPASGAAALAAGRRRSSPSPSASCSSVLMAVLFHPGVGSHARLLRHRHSALRPHGGATVAFFAASRPQPSLRARRTLHAGGPGRRRRLAVFWVRGRHAGRPAQELHVRGGLPALRRPRRPRRRRRPPGRTRPVLPRPRLATAALHRDHLLRHLPVALARDRLPQRVTHRPLRPCRSTCSHRRHAGRLHGELLPGRASRSAWPTCGAGSAGGARRWLVS